MKWKNCLVVEARFLTKYENLSFEYDDSQIFTIFEGNFDFRRGRSSGWQLIGFEPTKMLKMTHFFSFFAVTMICEFQQSKGIKVHKHPPGSPEERQDGPTDDLMEK